MRHSSGQSKQTALPYAYRINKRGHALLYYQDKLILVLNAKDSDALVKQLDHKSETEIQDVLKTFTGNFETDSIH